MRGKTGRVGLVLTVAVLAAALGVATGGTLRRLGYVRVLGVPVLVAAAVLQATAAVLGASGALRALLVGLAALAALAVVVANRWRPGVPLIGLGLLLNAAVVVANGAMPVSLVAAERAGVPYEQLHLDADPGHEEATPSTRLRLLGDVVPVASPLRREVVSVGDVLVAAGVAMFVLAGTHARPGRRRRAAPAPARRGRAQQRPRGRLPWVA
ncbi:DUF5317 domain-containing protein [Motilibacter deserti]|uniref:DUF5317 domain-containing protein n=1 Tax=Motilibacter deserti TaxID=2714956 RepID=A0ABX0GUC7_9ACTN|nr:DUF5317 domain-containing protein [Motilibacter deserti]